MSANRQVEAVILLNFPLFENGRCTFPLLSLSLSLILSQVVFIMSVTSQTWPSHYKTRRRVYIHIFCKYVTTTFTRHRKLLSKSFSFVNARFNILYFTPRNRSLIYFLLTLRVMSLKYHIQLSFSCCIAWRAAAWIELHANGLGFRIFGAIYLLVLKMGYLICCCSVWPNWNFFFFLGCIVKLCGLSV